ncbi:uncharacterized protein LOC132805404 [Ziziphus jujuba]|uniref:Uncharacterized protein LOC132805404 n=1 Tax=Ziziphus jujuba TaxID=326968 RepID=A0ABM4AHU0_ZIZJJ|nr:uncharacterized protein LOC132805404 [Ziziphus jujuba]
MSILSWNCRGLEKASTVRGLLYLVGKSSLLDLFLIETKAVDSRIHKIAKNLPFDNIGTIDAHHSTGSLALLWSKELDWTVVYKSDWIIEVEAILNNGKVVNCWFCYCPAKRTLRKDFWQELVNAVNSGSHIWMCMGDFKDVVSQEEKSMGQLVNSKSNHYLSNFMLEMGAIDIGYSGYSYTRCNRRWGNANIQERIDRVIASSEWRILFNQAGVVHLPPSGSDHLPIQLF